MELADAEDDENELSSMILMTLAGGPPGEIAEPGHTGAREGMKMTTIGHTYMNYRFYWKYVCSFTKWIPTNQFLNADMEFDPYSMTLERFGVVGIEKKCFWGLVGAKWLTPLKI